MGFGLRKHIAETVTKSVRVAAENIPWSTITFFSFDDFGYRWEWSDGEPPSAPNMNWWVRYKYPWNTPFGMVDYGVNQDNRPMIPPLYEYGFFEDEWSQKNIIEWYNALTAIVEQFPVNPNRKKIVYLLSDGQPTVWSENPLCQTAEQPCQTNAAASRADQFRATFPNIEVVAVWLDTQNSYAVDLLQNHVASSSILFNNASSNTILWGLTGFCTSMHTLNHPLHSFSDLYCEEICASNDGLCWPINGTSGYSTNQLTTSTPWMCAPWLVAQLVSTPWTWWMNYTWICESTNWWTGSNQCTATKQHCGDATINGPEVCETNGNIWCSWDQFCSQCNTCVTQWWCGYLDGKNVYDFDNAGDALTGDSLWLCVWWYSASWTWINYIATGFIYNDRLHIWTWSCIPENPLQDWQLWNSIKTSCSTTEMWCGDWTVQNTGNSIVYQQLNELLRQELASIDKIIWWNTTWVLLPWWIIREIADIWEMLNDLWSYKSHQERINSLQIPAEQCETHLDCSEWQNCFWCQCKVVGMCHPELQYFYAAQETPSYFENGTALCLYGQTANIVYDTNANERTYQCVWDPWTPTASCEVKHLFCGDDIVSNINSGYPADYEDCEPWVGIWCTPQCTADTYECQWPIPTNATLCVNDDQWLTWDISNSLVGLCSGPKKCEYVCNVWYDFDGIHCTQMVACNAKSLNSTWHNGDGSYAQYLSGTTLTPNYTTTHNSSNTTNACEFYCNANYSWNGTACTINMYTVVFSWNWWVWHTPTSKVVTWNTTLGTLPTDPVLTGYAFNGWWSSNSWWNSVLSSTVITWNRTVFAQWTQNPVTGECWNAHNQTYLYTVTQYDPDMQCVVWTPSTIAFPAPGWTVTWTCTGLNGWASSSQCSASRANSPVDWVCGNADWFVYPLTWATYAPLTQCATWTPTNTDFPAPSDSETWTCDWQYWWASSPTCSASRQSWSCDISNTYASWSVPGRRCPVGWTLAWWPWCYVCKRDALWIARCLMPECWNGVLDPGEVCDDANINNNDSCTNECQRPFCGDGIFTPSATWTTTSGTFVSLVEMCDPAMTWSSRCPWNCLLTWTLNASCNVLFEAHLWYNVTSFAELNQPSALCFPYWLATEWVHTNTTWKRSCEWLNWWLSATWCELPKRRCGDNVLDSWIIDDTTGLPAETCDDGNTDSWDGCSATCTIEPVVTWMPTSWLCTVQSYPQVEVGEYLPIWWLWSPSQHTIAQQTCSAIPFPGNGIQRNSIVWDLEIYRGWTEWLENIGSVDAVKIAQYNTTSTWMITDAIKDFGAEWQTLFWTHLIPPSQIETRVNNGDTPKYWQYLMRLPEMSYSYCAWSRQKEGTATGQTNVLTYTENCSNNFDDNWNGLVDCADTVFCGTADNCIVWTWGGGWNPGTCNTDADCQDLYVCNGQERCIWNSCQAAPVPPATPYDICRNILSWWQTDLMCDETSVLQEGCRIAQKHALGMSLCYEALINNNQWQTSPPCSALSFWSNPACTISNTPYNCQIAPIPYSSWYTFVWPLYNSNQPIPLSTTWWYNQLRAAFVSMNVAQVQSQLAAYNLQPNANYLSWLTAWQALQQWYPVAAPPLSRGWWSPWETSCSDDISNDTDWRIDCADGECATDPACTVGVNENCLNGYDDDWGWDLDSEDPDCVRWYQFEEWYRPVNPPYKTTKNYTYTWSNGYVCEAGFSVSKWYFVQQWFAFSEEANAWLDSSDFVSIGWVPLVTEWTVLDDGANNVSTYSQQWAKAYLFSGFIDTRELKATNNIQIWSDNWLIFKKVPNAHIYFWQWESQTNALWEEVLELNSYNRKLLLNRWWVPEWQELTTPYTIVLPWSSRQWSPKQVLDIQWTLTWNALYVSQWDIKFSSSQWSCDSSDTVEWLFIAAGEFTTTPINNKNPNATRRCKWWNLKIRGTLLWSNAWSSLAPLRRSVIDARNPNATFFDNSLVFKAKELFETCYLPALAMKKWNSIKWTPYTSSTWPLSNCNIDLLNTAANRENTIITSRWVRDDFLWLFTNPWNILATALTCTDPTPTSLCQKSIAFVYEMMDSVQNANSLFVIPKTIKKINALWSNPELIVTIEPSAVESFLNNPQTLLWKMNANSKRFPARWFAWMTNMPSTPVWQNYVQVIEDVVFNVADKPKMMNDVSKAFGGIKDHFIGFSNLYKQDSPSYTVSLNPNKNISSLLYKLSQIFWVWTVEALKFTNYLWSFPSISISTSQCNNYCENISWQCNNTSFTKYVCSADNKWLREKAIQANTQWINLASNIVDWSSVVISSQPKLWTDLPPGAKDFLNNIVVVPK
jgi:uncharacterized repeat protein (TIGR02543 family)